MWNRKIVKSRARKSLSDNFWKGVLVSVILGAIGGGVFFGGGGGSAATAALPLNNHKIYEIEKNTGSVKPIDEEKELETADEIEKILKEEAGIDTEVDEALEEVDNTPLYFFAGMLMLVVGIAGLVVSVVSVIIDSAFIKPIVYGGKRFFRKNLDEPALCKMLKIESFEQMNYGQLNWFNNMMEKNGI